MSPDLAASIKARLLNLSRQTGEEHELTLVRYACERFLYRLGRSPMRDRCVLKGARLLTLWMDDPYRASRDVDLLTFAPNSEASVRSLVETVCAIPCAEDALRFDLDSLALSPIRIEEEYEGWRAVLFANLGKATIRVQIDFGFGDVVRPAPEDGEFPTILPGVPRPDVRVYPRVASLAEKFHAMVRHGRQNSRMKDFHDVWALSSEFAFDGPSLREALYATFERRREPWKAETPDALRAAFYEDPAIRSRWTSYLGEAGFRTPPPESFEEIGERVRAFFGPARDTLVAGSVFDLRWPPGGPWR